MSAAFPGMDDHEPLVLTPIAPVRLGRYVLLGRLGYGGMAQIFLGRASGEGGFEKLVVVKRLHDHLVDDPQLIEMFLDEARIAAYLNHPNIVQTFDVGVQGNSYFLVMEYVEGQHLARVVRYAKKMDRYPPPELWASLMIPVLDGLHHAHTLHDPSGVPLEFVHRDVSPPNILLTYEGSPKLLDFGIAKAAQRSVETAPGTFKGKYQYMSPEQCVSEELDARSDIFSAGIVLYELCTGTHLFHGESELRIVQRVLGGDVPPPQKVNPMLHPRLAATIMRALEQRPENRWRSAGAFRDALEDDLEAIHYRNRTRNPVELMHDLFADVLSEQRARVAEAFANQPDETQPVIIPPAPIAALQGSGPIPDMDLVSDDDVTRPATLPPEEEPEEPTDPLRPVTGRVDVIELADEDEATEKLDLPDILPGD